MAIFKCKMCGGSLEISDNQTTAICEYCGTQQTVPTAKDENLQGLFNRANILRMKSEFDKAEQIYEKIIEIDNTQAEAYWGVILCKFGIEYVEDPVTFKRVPTCHRTALESIIADNDYKSAINYACEVQRNIYEAEAKEIDRLQKEIITLSQKEEPYDIFICYKETDETGKRTQDSVIANDIYYQLTQEGFKVFYAAITLEDKLGSAYEPYIFAALNSARVMLSIGTKPEYFNAVWVKNEWSRFLKIMKKDRSKVLIPCYKDMDAYELPEEFAHLQAQDMSKIGFINDIVRGIKKVVFLPVSEESKMESLPLNNSNSGIAPLLKRAFMFLEDGEFSRADEFFEQVLNQNPENAQAYLGKLMVELKVRKKEDLKEQLDSFENNGNYQKALRFGDNQFKLELQEIIFEIKYQNASRRKCISMTREDYEAVADEFQKISKYKDSARLAEECLEKAEEARKNIVLIEAERLLTNNTLASYEKAVELYKSISGWKESDSRIEFCRQQIERWKLQEERTRLEQQRKKEQYRIATEKWKKKVKKIACVVFPVIAVVTVFLIILNVVVIPSVKYNNAVNLINSGNYRQAWYAFQILGNYKDAAEHRNNIFASEHKYISVGYNHTVALKADGTVMTVGSNEHGQRNVRRWSDIVSISAGSAYTVGLEADSTVVAVGDNRYGQCSVDDWNDIVSISTGSVHTVGLKADGTVVAVGDNRYGQCSVDEWSDIASISAGSAHTVGLKADGTVVAVGDNDYGQCSVDDWSDIVSISTNANYTIGLKMDGTVVAVGDNDYGQCNVDGWKDVKIPHK